MIKEYNFADSCEYHKIKKNVQCLESVLLLQLRGYNTQDDRFEIFLNFLTNMQNCYPNQSLNQTLDLIQEDCINGLYSTTYSSCADYVLNNI